MIQVEPGDCLEVMARLKAEGVTVQSIVTDPPYHLTSIVKRFANADPAKEHFARTNPTSAYRSASAGFMGKQWDGGDIAFRPETWRLCYDLLPPGGYLLAFGLPRTFARMQVAVEDAGFEIRDTITDLVDSTARECQFVASLNDEQRAALSAIVDEKSPLGVLLWTFGSGFPKSNDVSKGIDKAAGVERQVIGTTVSGDTAWFANGVGNVTTPATPAAREWQGWGTALKPAAEFIVMARKPIEGSVAANVLKFGTGAINVDASRVGYTSNADKREETRGKHASTKSYNGLSGDGAFGGLPAGRTIAAPHQLGRWPANLAHDGSPEVMEAFAAFGETARGNWSGRQNGTAFFGGARNGFRGNQQTHDSGTAARFFYSAKADAHDRWGSKHPTVKPIDLMRWLVRMVTPPGGTVLDPFAGSGTTGIACLAEGFDCILIEREEAYLADIRERLAHYSGEGRHSMASKARHKDSGHGDLPLFVK